MAADVEPPTHELRKHPPFAAPAFAAAAADATAVLQLCTQWQLVLMLLLLLLVLLVSMPDVVLAQSVVRGVVISAFIHFASIGVLVYGAVHDLGSWVGVGSSDSPKRLRCTMCIAYGPGCGLGRWVGRGE